MTVTWLEHTSEVKVQEPTLDPVDPYDVLAVSRHTVSTTTGCYGSTNRLTSQLLQREEDEEEEKKDKEEEEKKRKKKEKKLGEKVGGEGKDGEDDEEKNNYKRE